MLSFALQVSGFGGCMRAPIKLPGSFRAPIAQLAELSANLSRHRCSSISGQGVGCGARV